MKNPVFMMTSMAMDPILYNIARGPTVVRNSFKKCCNNVAFENDRSYLNCHGSTDLSADILESGSSQNLYFIIGSDLHRLTESFGGKSLANQEVSIKRIP